VARLGREFGEHREGVDAEVNEGEECVGRERKSGARRRAFGRGSGPRGWDIRKNPDTWHSFRQFEHNSPLAHASSAHVVV